MTVAEHVERGIDQALVLAAARGNRDARERLVLGSLPLIRSMARRFERVAGIEHTELMQDGVVGLLRALERYDPEAGRFWPYAQWWVRQAMQKLVAEMRHPVVLSDRALRQGARVRAARRAHLECFGKEPTTAELADASGMDREHVEALLVAERAPRALDAPAARDGEGETLGDQVGDPRAGAAFDDLVTRLAGESLRHLPGDLSPRERAVLKARYGLGCEARTLREVAEELGVSAERVRQIEQQALGKLRDEVDRPAAAGAVRGRSRSRR
jgi:RNA polymerase primary sigma factor